MRRLPVLLAALLASMAPSLVASPAARAAQRVEVIALPSTQGNIDLTKVKLNKGMTELRATVMLPDGYDEHPEQAYPVLYLLHGGGDTSETWAQINKGDITRRAAGFPGIVVMPEAGKGNFVDYWMGGRRNGPRWTSYYLHEVLPAISARYRILPGRQNHAIGGLSMGGYGALYLGGQLPGYFGTIVSMSGLLDIQTTGNRISTLYGAGVPFETMLGSITGQYATVHNPSRTIRNVALSRVYISAGNGVPDPNVPFIFNSWTLGVLAELRSAASAIAYGVLAPLSGLRPTIHLRRGVHEWAYWRRDIEKVIVWDVFKKPPVTTQAEARRWRYKTMEPTGNMWGLGYRFAEPTTIIADFNRNGQTLTGTGRGTVTINPGAAEGDASGNGTRPDCSFTATFPFSRTLPDGC